MGLDMYLRGRRYISSYSGDDEIKLKDGVREQFAELQGDQWEENPVQEVTAQVGYWRKANHVHKWFVDHVQGGEDECRPHSVSREDLERLREVCNEVLAKPGRAADLLPTASGFFFGNTDYNNYYLDDLRATVAIVDRALALPQNWDFEYQSSW